MFFFLSFVIFLWGILFLTKVVEVVNADALVVKTEKGQIQKVFFSSFRPPKKTEDTSETTQTQVTERCNHIFSNSDAILVTVNGCVRVWFILPGMAHDSAHTVDFFQANIAA